MSNMKEINDAKIHKKNMREKTAIANEIRYKKKSLENSPISRTVRTDDKIKANPNMKAVHEITPKERSYRKSPTINSISSFSNDDWTLKESPNFKMEHEYENLEDHNEYNILVKNKKNERQSQEINNIRRFKKYIIFKVTLAIIVLFIEKIIDIIYLIFVDFGIIDILLKIKNNSDIIIEKYNIFILASILIINGNILNNIVFYVNKINIESKRREETLIIPGVAPKIKIDNKKNGLIEMKNESKNMQNIKERIKIINEYNIININRKKKRNNENIGNINKLKEYIIIIKFIIILCSFISRIKSNKFNLYNISKITLKIKGTGYKYVLGIKNDNPSSEFSFKKKYYPNLIKINGNEKNDITYKYYFNQTDNFVELIWNNNINNCYSMFRRCYDIIEMDLSDFNTSEVTTMQWMFLSCSSLISLNLSNFDTSKVQSMQAMFSGCNNLEYINLKNFNENQLTEYRYMFDNVPSNIVVCIDERNTKILSKLPNINCRTIDCSDDWKLKQKKIISNNNCIDNCNTINEYEDTGKCVENCTNGAYIDDNNINKCKCELEKCLSCPPVALKNHLCTKCNNDYYPIENDESNIGEYINCYKEQPKGYYLDKSNSLYKKCYYSCETCEIEGNNITHNCLTCQYNFSVHINITAFSLF